MTTRDVDQVIAQLSETERRLLAALRGSKGPVGLDELAPRAGFESANAAYSAASWLRMKGLVEIAESSRRRLVLGAEGRRFAAEGVPERRVHAVVVKSPEGMALEALHEALDPGTVRIALAWWKRKNLGAIEKRDGSTVLVAAPDAPPSADEAALSAIAQAPDGLDESALDATQRAGLDALRGRPGVVEETEQKHRQVVLTALGAEAAGHAALEESSIGEVTPEMLRTGAWRGKSFQSYSVSTAAPRPAWAKPHPLNQIIDEVREIFVELGFSEIEEDYVQSAFWNLDALFIPQDHPAREMQDTFYLARPDRIEVEDELIRRIGRVHKSGAGTKSRGWGTGLDPDESRRGLLRTHTTVGTIRHLARHPDPPVRVFSVGRVFRHETMDATHLPEFHQVEGICTEKGADFPMLLGILQEFYRRLGFPKLRWRPAFFPYTEPSMEVEVFTEGRWMELGGCGIFRPEVTRPFGVKTPVLAWGLGLERLAMMRLGRKDIRDLYVSDLDWLRRQPLVG